jgi:hypothetical protein
MLNIVRSDDGALKISRTREFCDSAFMSEFMKGLGSATARAAIPTAQGASQ